MGVQPPAIVAFVRALRAAVHGFVDLELRGGFGLPDDIEVSFATTVDLVIVGIASHTREPSTRPLRDRLGRCVLHGVGPPDDLRVGARRGATG